MSSLHCSQCGRAAPTDPDELRTWTQGEFSVTGELDELTAAMVLCADCVQEDLSMEYDAGESG
jgi:hypothetical protein